MKKVNIFFRHADKYNVIRFSHQRIEFQIYKQMSFDLLEIIYRGGDISVSQYVDMNQNQIPSEERIRELQALYNLRIDVPVTPLDNVYFYKNARVYNLHVLGKINQGWLTQIINFGGLSLPNVFWGDISKFENNQTDFSEWDEKVLRLYSANSQDEFFNLLASQSIICMTIGTELNILTKNEDEAREIIKKIEKLTHLYGFSLTFNEHTSATNFSNSSSL